MPTTLYILLRPIVEAENLRLIRKVFCRSSWQGMPLEILVPLKSRNQDSTPVAHCQRRAYKVGNQNMNNVVSILATNMQFHLFVTMLGIIQTQWCLQCIDSSFLSMMDLTKIKSSRPFYITDANSLSTNTNCSTSFTSDYDGISLKLCQFHVKLAIPYLRQDGSNPGR